MSAARQGAGPGGVVEVAGGGLVVVAGAAVVVVVGPGVLAVAGLVAALAGLEVLDELPQAAADRPATISSVEASE